MFDEILDLCLNSPCDISRSTVMLWSYENTLKNENTVFNKFFFSVSVFDACSQEYHDACTEARVLS